MYKILGGDGKEYGPVSVEALQQWINEGRANAQTQVQAEGTTGWVALGELPEFAAGLNAPPPAGAPAPLLAGAVPPVGDAAQMVSGPAIGLIVAAALGALAQIAGMLMNILGVGINAANRGMHGQPEIPAWVNMMSGGLGIVFNIIGLIMAVVVFLGALKMKKLENYGFALTATIIAMVPCVSPCCWVGLPVGIWALVILQKPEVKAAFQTT